MNPFLLCLFTLSLLTPLTASQQTYSGNSVLDCTGEDKAGPSPDFLYTCNGRKNHCRAFLIFKSQPPFNSVPTISTLMSSDQLTLAEVNNATVNTIFPTNKEVIVPVNCSCSGQYYLARTTFHVIIGDHSTLFTVANDTFQGLATCDSLKRVNPNTKEDNELKVPLRCACPTRNQIASGARYLLTYTISWEDTVRNIGEKFNVTEKSIFEANGFSIPNPTIFPFTTILVPLRAKPSFLQILYPKQNNSSPLPGPVSLENKANKERYVGFGVGIGFCVLIIVVMSSMFWIYKRRKETGPTIKNHRELGRRKFVLPSDLRVEIASLEEIPRAFRFEDLKKATRNFQRRIEGSVYRATIGKETLAVKKMSQDVSKEVKILKKTNHFNLVQLRGFCEAVGGGGCNFLVFEYMSNGSLRDWLHRKSSKKVKEWSQRIQIALDVANGLHYLHNFTEPPYVHMNINSCNVLLDGNLRGKIGNFGLAEVAMKEEGVAPEVDVYAFGGVMLELITGKHKVILKNAEDEEGGIIRYFVDQRLESSGERLGKLGMKMVKLSLSCLEEDPSRRPRMEEIVSGLLMIQLDLLSSLKSESSLSGSAR